MQLDILLFGITKEIIGRQKLAMEVPAGTTVATLKDILRNQFPGLHHLNAMAIAINSAYVKEDVALNPNDEIALIPPVSGG